MPRISPYSIRRMAMALDLVIKNGTVVNGSGMPAGC
jgi:hypothetical protein